jgi:hypothetical protein
LPSAEVFSQHVCDFRGVSAAPTVPPSSEHRHPRTSNVFINFIIFKAAAPAGGGPSIGLRPDPLF